MKAFLHFLLKKLNLKLSRYSTSQRKKVSNLLNTIKNKKKLDNTNKCLPYFYSQFGQDLFVLNELNLLNIIVLKKIINIIKTIKLIAKLPIKKAIG